MGINCKTCDYKLRVGTVEKNISLCSDIISLRIKLDEGSLAFEPGQFVMLSVFGYGEVPIGITTTPDIKEYFEVCIRNVGTVTKAIHGLKAGEKIGVRGPYGNGFEKDRLHGKDVIIIAGGIGMAPLRSLIEYIQRHRDKFKSLQILYGSKNPDEILYESELSACQSFSDVMLTVDKPDNNWDGHVGIVTELIDKTKITTDSAVIMCGPPVMYKFVIPLLEKHGIHDEDIHILLERRMKCGIGKCQHCTFGDKYVCLDGPVFRYSDIKNNMEAI